MEEVFSPILDNDEKVLKVIKPNKFAFYFKNLLLWFLWGVFILGSTCFGVIMGLTEDMEEGVSLISESELKTDIIICVCIFGAILVVTLLLVWLFLHLYYKNVYYAYTNKRILIRKGVFGVDYQSLDIKMIGASTVNVSLFDKILRKNTGRINFGSMASPINGTNTANTFILSNVVDPYGLYKEIKNHISNIIENKVDTETK